jgi:hypothetical protein
MQNLDRQEAIREDGSMETIVDLPDALIREIKLRAESRRQDLKDAVVDLLRQGLATPAKDPGELIPPVVKTHPKTGLPFAECPHAASADEEMTPERVSDLLLQQEAAWHHEAR